MVKIAWVVLALLIGIAACVIFFGGMSGAAPEGAWGELTSGSPAAVAPTLLFNADFSKEQTTGWMSRPERRGPGTTLPDGRVIPYDGRSGGAFWFPPTKAESATQRAVFAVPIPHCDWYLDGHARVKVTAGTARVAIEYVFQDGNGDAAATYIAWAGPPGTPPPAAPGALVEEMALSDGEWRRVPSRTTWDLKQKGLAMPRSPVFLEVRLRLDVENGSAEAWFDDLDLRDMKAGR